MSLLVQSGTSPSSFRNDELVSTHRSWKTTALVSAVVTVGLVSAPPSLADDSDQLLGREWKSTKVKRNGELHPLFDPTTVRVGFGRVAESYSLHWKAKCNTAGSEATIGRRRITLDGPGLTTNVGCPERTPVRMGG
jgi:hypothetical protein